MKTKIKKNEGKMNNSELDLLKSQENFLINQSESISSLSFILSDNVKKIKAAGYKITEEAEFQNILAASEKVVKDIDSVVNALNQLRDKKLSEINRIKAAQF
ncbi:MAG: hypothetical protein CMF23_14490 [Ignavibacteriae bacterium]|nr:hypothetical protein [Ignavibacteriota bacterium]